MRATLVTAVWGGAYLDYYLKFALPSQLAPGNVPALAGEAEVRYLVYTNHRGAVERLMRSSALRAMNTHGRIEVRLLEETAGEEVSKFTRMKACHNHAIEKVRREGGGGVVVLAPDAVLADGSLGRVGRSIAAGRKVVVNGSLRAVRSELAPRLLLSGRYEGEALVLPARELMGMALECMHPMTGALLADSPGQGCSWQYSSMLWPVREGERTVGLLGRCFATHPVWVEPRAEDPLPMSSVDQGWIGRLVGDAGEVELLQDSDEFLVVDAATEDQCVHAVDRRGCAAELLEKMAEMLRGEAPSKAVGHAIWVLLATSGVQRGVARRGVRFHADEGKGEAWERAERESEAWIGMVLETVQRVADRAPKDETFAELARQFVRDTFPASKVTGSAIGTFEVADEVASA